MRISTQPYVVIGWFISDKAHCKQVFLRVYQFRCTRKISVWFYVFMNWMFWSLLHGLQGGEDVQDALSLQVVLRRRALFLVALWREKTCN